MSTTMKKRWNDANRFLALCMLLSGAYLTIPYVIQAYQTAPDQFWGHAIETYIWLASTFMFFYSIPLFFFQFGVGPKKERVWKAIKVSLIAPFYCVIFAFFYEFETVGVLLFLLLICSTVAQRMNWPLFLGFMEDLAISTKYGAKVAYFVFLRVRGFRKSMESLEDEFSSLDGHK